MAFLADSISGRDVYGDDQVGEGRYSGKALDLHDNLKVRNGNNQSAKMADI